MIGLLLALYPAPWRRRYGEEFRAVLESRPLGPFDVADILLGALDARARALRLAGLPENDGGNLTMLKIGGLGAVAGGVLAAIGFIGGSAFQNDDTTPLWFGLIAAGNVALLLALVGLSAFQAHRHPRLTWAAFVIPAAGTIVSLVGVYGLGTRNSDVPMLLGWSAWEIWAAGVVATILGSSLFGAATLRANVLSRPAAAALAATSILLLLVAVLGTFGLEDPAPARVVIAAAVIAFGASWAWLGIGALRQGPIRALAAAA